MYVWVKISTGSTACSYFMSFIRMLKEGLAATKHGRRSFLGQSQPIYLEGCILYCAPWGRDREMMTQENVEGDLRET